MNTNNVKRRDFLQSTSVAVAAGCALHSAGALIAEPIASLTPTAVPDALKGRLWKTLKIGMVNVPGSLTDKFKAAKAAGFDGIELNAPGFKIEETKKAIEESGLPVDGTVNSSHWDVRHTDPDAGVRAKAPSESNLWGRRSPNRKVHSTRSSASRQIRFGAPM